MEQRLESLITDDCVLGNLGNLSELDTSLLPLDELPCNLSDELSALLANLSAQQRNSAYGGAGDHLYYPEYYSTNYRIVGTLFQTFIFVVGVLGNVLVVLVVHRTSGMHTPTNCYLVSLAVADCMVLVAAVPEQVIAYYLVGDEWIWGRVGCALLIFLQYAGINASSLSITAFTVERYIAICRPMKAQTVCTVARAKRIICCVWLFAVCYCSPWLFLTTTVPLRYAGMDASVKCTFALTRASYMGYYFADLVMFYVIPLLVSCVLYALITRVLYTSTMPKTPGGQAANNGFHETSGGNTGGKTMKVRSSNVRTTVSSRAQVVKMLVTVVALFALLWLPYRVFVVYNSVASEPYMELWFLMFAKTMVYINSAINPILYNAMSVKFRRAFRRMLSCGKRSEYDFPSRYYSVALQHSNTVTSSMRNTTWRPPYP